MNSITMHLFNANLVQSAVDAPLGRYGTETAPKDTLSVVKINVPADPEKNEEASSYFQVVRTRDPTDSAIAYKSDDLADVARELNLCIPFVFEMTRNDGKLTPYAFKADQFVTEINALIQKRNDKIDSSGWIAFLDVMLKILTLGLFNYKESLRAPLLNPIHWKNTFDPAVYKFDVDVSCSRTPIDHAESISRFFQATLPPIPNSAKRESPEAQQLRSDKEQDFMSYVAREFQTAEAVQAGQQPIMKDSRWSQTLTDKFMPDSFTKSVTGEVQSTSLSQGIGEVEILFNLGLLSSGVVTCHTHDGNEVVKIAIRKIEGGQYALLTLDKKEVHYKVGAPFSLKNAIPDNLLNSINSLSFIPLGTIDIKLPEKKPDQQ